ncbi:hypothetical protein ONK27_27950, partial [Salmonella enterica subsp. enterica serovar Virginia]|nr:hypothetical protein [Salmonella enterica subsp. enterica serovar Virginia]
TRRYPSISLTMLTGNDNVNLQRAGIDLAIYFDDAPSAQLTHHAVIKAMQWQMDFRKLKKGDEFSVLMSREMLDGKREQSQLLGV